MVRIDGSDRVVGGEATIVGATIAAATVVGTWPAVRAGIGRRLTVVPSAATTPAAPPPATRAASLLAAGGVVIPKRVAALTAVAAATAVLRPLSAVVALGPIGVFSPFNAFATVAAGTEVGGILMPFRLPFGRSRPWCSGCVGSQSQI